MEVGGEQWISTFLNQNRKETSGPSHCPMSGRHFPDNLFLSSIIHLTPEARDIRDGVVLPDHNQCNVEDERHERYQFNEQEVDILPGVTHRVPWQ